MKISAIGYIADIIGGKEFEKNVKEGVRIRDIIKLPERIELRIIVLVNDKPVNLDYKVRDMDNITIMPIVGGG